MEMVPTLRVLVYVFLCAVFIFQDENLALSFGVMWGRVSWFFADSSRPTGLANK